MKKKYGKESFANEARGRHLQFIVMFLWLKCQVAIHQYLLSDLSFFRTIALVAAIPPLSSLYFPENLFNLSLLLGFSKSPNLKLATKQIYQLYQLPLVTLQIDILKSIVVAKAFFARIMAILSHIGSHRLRFKG